MSDIRTFTVMLHTDSSKPATATDRLSVTRWKVTKDNPTPHATRCVSVPRTSISVTPDCLRDKLTAAFNDAQDELIRVLIEQHLDLAPNDATFTLSETEINAEAIASYYAESEITGRLSKQLLEAWYDTSLATALAAAFARKNNVHAESETIKKVVISYRGFIAGLSAPRASYPDNILTNLEKAIALADSSDPLRNQLLAKLAKLKQPKEQTLADTL